VTRAYSTWLAGAWRRRMDRHGLPGRGGVCAQVQSRTDRLLIPIVSPMIASALAVHKQYASRSDACSSDPA